MQSLQIRSLTKKYDGFLLDNVSFSVPQGAVVGLIGENGAGKSTVMKSVQGAVRADEGSILFQGKPIGELSREEKQKIGFVQDVTCLPLEMGISMLDKVFSHIFVQWNSDRFFDLCRKFSLPEKKAVKDFSKGMRMKAAIAVALSYESELLLLYEPTYGLDPVVRDEILEILYDYMQDGKRAILISSHITSDLEKLCDYIVYIHEGRVLFDEEKDALLEKFVVFSCEKSALKELDPARVERVLLREYGADVLVRKDCLPQGFCGNRAGLDEIMLFYAKGERLCSDF